MRRGRVLLSFIVLLVAGSGRAAVTGRIASADGKPLGGVEVIAVRPMTSTAALAGSEPKVLGKTESAANGIFELEAAGGGVIDLRIRTDGYAPLDLVVGADESVGTLTLERAALVTGHVKAAGKPLPAARVIAASNTTILAVTTDGSGAYRLPDPKVWAQAIVAHHADFAPATHPATSLDFSLEGGRLLKGQVVDMNGKPAAGVAVDVDFVQRASTGADGTFTLPHIGERSTRVRALTSGGVVVSTALKGDPVLRLKPAVRLRGVVRDEARKPLAGAVVRAFCQRESFADEVTSDAEGAFTFAAVPRGEVYLIADAGRSFEFEATAVDTSSGDVIRDLSGTHRPSIIAIVTNADGSRAVGASMFVFVRHRNGMQAVVPAAASTGVDGTARVHTSFDAEYTSSLLAMVPALPPATSEPLTATSREVRLVIPAGEPVTGVVSDSEGKPLSGVEVAPVVASSPFVQGGDASPFMESDGSTRAFTWARTAQDGSFSARLQPGTALLRFSRQGYVDVEQKVVVSAKMPPIKVALTRSLLVSGRVTDDSGAPIADVPVMIGSNLDMSGEDGAFSIEVAKSGVVAVRYGQRMYEARVTAPSTSVKLVLPRRHKVSGKVVSGSTGRAVESFTVEMRTDDSGHRPSEEEAFSSSDGAFSVDIEPGTKLSVKAPGYVSVADIDPATNPLVITLSRGRTVRGRIIDDQKQPLSGVGVSLSDGESFGEGETGRPSSRADGTYEITGIAPDADADLSFSKEGYLDLKKKVPAGTEDAALDVVMRHGLAVSGRVVRASGAAAPNVTVSASSAGHGASYESAETDENGVFRFANLAASRYDFSVSRTEEGEQGVVRDVDVEKVREVTLRLQKSAVCTVTGKIIDADSAAGQVMVMVSNAEGESQNGGADPAGNFRVENAPVGTIEIRAMRITPSGGRYTRRETVDAVAGSEVRVELHFARQVRLLGMVTRKGAPVDGVRLLFSGEISVTGASGESGRYAVDLEEGDYEVQLSLGDQQLYSRKVSVVEGHDLDFALDDASLITAAVIDSESGQPLSGVAVTASHRGETHTVTKATTGGDGVARLEVVGDEPLTIVAQKLGYGNASADAVSSQSSSVTLRLVRTRGSAIRIVDRRDNRTLSGYVIARDRAGRIVASSSDTDADGTTILPLAAGDYQVSASAEGYGSQTVAGHVPAEGEIRVPLPRGGSLALKALNDLRGTARLLQPDGQLYVRCWCNGISTIEIETSMTLVDRIAPGPYTLEVIPKSGKARRIAVTVVEGETGTVIIE